MAAPRYLDLKFAIVAATVGGIVVLTAAIARNESAIADQGAGATSITLLSGGDGSSGEALRPTARRSRNS